MNFRIQIDTHTRELAAKNTGILVHHNQKTNNEALQIYDCLNNFIYIAYTVQ
jgi:hypothetical protein